MKVVHTSVIARPSSPEALGGVFSPDAEWLKQQIGQRGPLAVFVITNIVRAIAAHSKRMRIMYRDYPQQFMGIYTDECPIQWIDEDLRYMRAAVKWTKNG